MSFGLRFLVKAGIVKKGMSQLQGREKHTVVRNQANGQNQKAYQKSKRTNPDYKMGLKPNKQTCYKTA